MADLISIKLTNKPTVHFDAMAENLKAERINMVFKAATLAGGMVGRILQAQGGTGKLAGSFSPATFIREDEATVSAGALSDLVYADVQNRGTAHLPGGAIRPKPPRRMLAIPVSPEGKARLPRDWPEKELALIKSKRGNPILIQSDTEGRVQVHYVLVPNTRLQGTRYLERAEKAVRPQVEKVVGKSVRTSIAGGIDTESEDG